MTPEKKGQFKKEKIENLNKEIAELELSINDMKNQYEKGLKALEDKLDELKFQKELFK